MFYEKLIETYRFKFMKFLSIVTNLKISTFNSEFKACA